MSNIIKCENCGCEEIDIIHKYKGYYVCPKCGRDTERLYEIEHDKEIRAKAIDDVFDYLKTQRKGIYMRVDFDDLEIRQYKEKLKAGEIDE